MTTQKIYKEEPHICSDIEITLKLNSMSFIPLNSSIGFLFKAYLTAEKNCEDVLKNFHSEIISALCTNTFNIDDLTEKAPQKIKYLAIKARVDIRTALLDFYENGLSIDNN